jgi:hypothetical protein
MSKQTINIGASPNDGTGTPLRTSFDYTNQNFTEIYTALGGGVALPGATTQVIFNDGGTNLAGDAGLVYNKTTDALTVAGLVTAGSAAITGDLTVDTSTLKVDSTNNRVGIGTATPAVALDVVGSINTTSNVVAKGGSALIVNRADNLTSTQLSDSGSGGFLINNLNSSGINLQFAGVTALALNPTANLVLKGGTAAANGVGVTFPATQVTSSDANCLDDYEEGAWAPTVSNEVNLTSTTLVSARYTKIGRVVTVSGSVTTFIITSNTLAYFALQNLPFTAATIVPGALYNDTRNTSGNTQVTGTLLYGLLPAASGTTSGSAMTLYFSNTYTV